MSAVDLTPIDVTPAEALVLLEPNKKQGREPYKVSLMWLLAQRHLVATEVKTGWFGGKTTRLTRGPNAGQPLPRDLQAVMDTVYETPSGLVTDLVKTAQKRFGVNLLGFRADTVLPSLQGRRLLSRREEKFLVLFTRERWDHTAAGTATSARIERMLVDARRIPEYLDRSPAQAAALAATLGGLILLVPELRPHLDGIANVMRRRETDPNGSGDGGSNDASSSGSPSTPADAPDQHWSPDAIDPSPFQFDFGNLDFGNLDGIDASLSALDLSFDSAADSAGGDGGGGGGGDGGGGGGGGD